MNSISHALLTGLLLAPLAALRKRRASKANYYQLNLRTLLRSSAAGVALAFAGQVGGADADVLQAGAPFDLQGFLNKEIAAGRKRIVVPPGRYRVSAEGAVHVTLAHANDLEIVAEGVTMICTRRTRAIEFRECRNVRLRGLTIDYDPLTFTQGKVTAVAGDKGWIEIKLDAGYPREPWARIDVVDPATRFRRKGMPFLWGTTAKLVQPDVVRVVLKDIGKAAPVGMLASLSSGNEKGGVCHGVTLERCRGGMELHQVTLHCAPGMGIVEAGGDGGTVLEGVRIVPGPRPAGAMEDRLLTTSWDGILHTSVGRGPRVENNIVEACGDDSWSVQSSDYLALRVERNTVVLGTRSDAMWLRVGDRLRWSNDSPEWIITGLQPVALSEAGVSANVVEKIKSAQPWSLWKINAHTFARVMLDRAAGFDVGQSLFSPDRQGNGFVFRGNRVHSPGRILIKASDGLVEDNHLLMPHSVVLCPEVPAEAAAGIHDVILRRNTIVESGYFCPGYSTSQAGAISISAVGAGSQLRPPGVFDRIRIEDNTLRGINGVNLCLTSARQVVVQGNRFLETHQTEPNHTGARYQIDQSSVVWIAQTQGVELTGNEVRGRGSFAGKVMTVAPTATGVVGADTGFQQQKRRQHDNMDSKPSVKGSKAFSADGSPIESKPRQQP